MVVNRFELRRQLAAGEESHSDDTQQDLSSWVHFEDDGTIRFARDRKTDDEWLYLDLDPTRHRWRDVRWKFRVRRHSRFREFQFGFRYRGFHNRYRYRFERDMAFFDIVENGAFHNCLSAAPLPLQLGQWHDVTIDIVGSRFRLCVDGQIVLDDFDFAHRFPDGSGAVILWEPNGGEDLCADVGPIHITRLDVTGS